MKSRTKSLLIYFISILGPLLLLGFANYIKTESTIDSSLNNVANNTLNSLIENLDRRLQESESQLTRLSLLKSLPDFAKHRTDDVPESASITSVGTTPKTTPQTPAEIQISFASALNSRNHWRQLTLYSREQQTPLLQVRRSEEAMEGSDIDFRLMNFSPATFDTEVALTGKESLRLMGSTLQGTAPVFDSSGHSMMGVLANEASFADIVGDVAASLEARQSGSRAQSLVLVVAKDGTIVYHSNHVFQGQLVSNATPELTPLVTAANSNSGGIKNIRFPNGDTYATAFEPVPRLGVAVAVSRNRSVFDSTARQWLLLNILFSFVIACACAFMLERYIRQRSKGIARVTEGLSAIAKGELDRRIDLKSSDDARGIADGINVMTEKLRGQLAREAESRQFQTFVRLSAMLTHDLKNAIEALSLTVGNMERHFDNEQFRADAMKSVAGATEKLKTVVARLTRPLTSLSGEHKRPSRIDLVPMLKRSVAATAGPLSHKHKINLELPDRLEATVNVEGLEGVVENLVLNALEAMSEKAGTLTVHAAKVDDNWVAFSVSDTGAGMSKDFIDNKLFRPFSTTKRRGIGLGLYTCRETVQASGGRIEVDSREGAGTTFRIVLPFCSFDGRSL